MVSMAIGGSGGLLDDAVGVGLGIASMAGANIPGMLRCIDPEALGLVYFDFNPDKISMTCKPQNQSQGSSRGGATQMTTARADLPTIQLKTTMVGEDVKMRVDTLFAWCAPPQGLFTALTSLITGAPASTKPPDVTFQWGPPMLGFMYTVQLKSVQSDYIRFHSSGIPIRADVTIQMQTKPNLLSAIPTNPTSGGLPGRNTHLVRENESLQSIAQHYYGRPGLWRKIAEINGITNPNRVRPGVTVYLPSPGEIPVGGR